MAKVFSFAAALEAQEEREQTKKIKQFFLKLFSVASREEKLAILDAIEKRDSNRYFELTTPLVLKIAMREVFAEMEQNTGISFVHDSDRFGLGTFRGRTFLVKAKETYPDGTTAYGIVEGNFSDSEREEIFYLWEQRQMIRSYAESGRLV